MDHGQPESLGLSGPAISEGIVIDGLPILTARASSASIPDLDIYYDECVIGGKGAFLLKITGMKDFADTILSKLILEIRGLELSKSLPGTLPLTRVGVREGYNCFIGEEMLEPRY